MTGSGVRFYRTWMAILGSVALLNLLLVVDDPDRWWNWISTVVPLASGAYTTVTHWRIKAMNAPSAKQGTTDMKVERETTFFPPGDRYDTFCTCPRCGLLGTTSIEWGTFRKRTIPGSDGEQIHISTWSDPPDGTPITTRTCGFCAHIWSVSGQRETR